MLSGAYIAFSFYYRLESFLNSDNLTVGGRTPDSCDSWVCLVCCSAVRNGRAVVRWCPLPTGWRRGRSARAGRERPHPVRALYLKRIYRILPLLCHSYPPASPSHYIIPHAFQLILVRILIESTVLVPVMLGQMLYAGIPVL